MSETAQPHGFREHASGLIVPAEISREREVWTHDEWRVIERATKLLISRNVGVLFACPEKQCQGKPMERHRRPDGGITLRCAHKDREFTKALK